VARILGDGERKKTQAFCELQSHYRTGRHDLRSVALNLVVHVLMHESRHWTQIGTLFRVNGLTGEFRDFLFSPVLGR
jgi:uncharacterized damage-inducible protein DinB